MSLVKEPILPVCMSINPTECLVLLELNLSDGAGLFCGVLEYFLGLGSDSPKIVAATHFHEIFERNFMRPTARLGFGHMDVRVDKEASSVEDQITYLYTYVFLLTIDVPSF